MNQTSRTLRAKRRSGRGWAALMLAAAGLAGCESGGSGLTAPTPAAPPPFMAASTARYRVTFDATWSAETHPDEAPPNPHWSGLIGGTHRDAVRFWADGGIASDGIKAMAELGNKTPLDVEVQTAIQAGTAQHVLSGGALSGSPGSVALDFEVSRDYPLVTLVSMVAPSPDWFVGVSGLSLFDGTDWVGERVVALQPWDAGTDGGASFLSPDRPLDPRAPISRIGARPFLVGGTVPPLGTFTFRRLP